VNHEELEAKVNEMREVMNHQSEVIRSMKKEIDSMKIVLGYHRKLRNAGVFFKTIEAGGVDLEKAMEDPETFEMALDAATKG